jgi:hypothetical protein
MLKCVCGNFHCPSCLHQMEGLKCGSCGTEWTGDEVFPEPEVELSSLYEV